MDIDEAFIQKELSRRRPGQSHVTTSRKEDDKVTFLSGIFNGKSTGTPIGFFIPNNNKKSADYENIKNVFRPSHADFTYQEKYGIRDYRGVEGLQLEKRHAELWQELLQSLSY